MNEFDELDAIEKKTGKAIELMKDVEFNMDNIILDYVTPKNLGFTRNIILNSSIIQTGAKIKILKTICSELKIDYKFDNLHKMVNIRNVFAHGKSYTEEGDIIFKLAEIKSNGKINEGELDKLLKEFVDLFNTENQELIKLHGEIKGKNKSSC